MEQLFKSVSADATAQAEYALERRLLKFVADNEGTTAGALDGPEKAKVQGYADSLEAIRDRNRKIDGMAERIRRHVPVLDEKLLSGDINTIER